MSHYIVIAIVRSDYRREFVGAVRWCRAPNNGALPLLPLRRAVGRL